MISRSFQTVRRMREAWKRETYVRSQSFSSESAVKYLHVGRRKIQISPPLGEQDQSNALPQGQQRQSNPHPMPCLPPPRRHDIDRCIRGWLMDGYLSHASLNLPSEEWRRKDILFSILYPACVISSWKANFHRLGCPAGSIIMKKGTTNRFSTRILWRRKSTSREWRRLSTCDHACCTWEKNDQVRFLNN